MLRSSGKRSKTLFVFYLLLVYVMAQFGWWTYLIFDLNKEIFHQREVIIHLEQEQFGEPLMDTEVVGQKWEKKIWMILGEGSVFLLLLILGAFFIQRSFKKEQALANQQRNFLLSITHELNSPLASIKLYLQTITLRNLTKEKQDSVVEHALSETDRLGALVDNLLLATRIENNKSPFHLEREDFSAFVKTFSEKPLYTALQSHQIEWEIEDGLQIMLDPLAMNSLLGNLVENAVKYSSEGSLIQVILKKEDEQAVLMVADNGVGIGEAEKENIFLKFYREGSEDTRKTKGTGLGLFIVKTVVEAHGGRIKVLDNQPKGTIFTVLFSTS